jgi:two-component system, NtrC family, response regulator AtoC
MFGQVCRAGRRKDRLYAMKFLDGTTGSLLDDDRQEPYFVLSWGDQGRIVPLPEGMAQITIGREASCDVQLDARDLSRWHATVRVSTDGDISIEDRGSAHGVEVDGRKLEPGAPARILPGQVYRLGSVSMVLHGVRKISETVEYAPKGALLQQCESRVRALAETPLVVAILGDSGSGKGYYARFLHNASKQSNDHYVRVDAYATSEERAERDLFGTGAAQGLLHRSTGTLVIDEFANLSIALQKRMAATISAGCPMRIVLTSSLPLRVNGALNKRIAPELAAWVQQSYVVVPPLRSREEDIEGLFRYAVTRIAERRGSSAWSIAADAIAALRSHAWPGNVRELFQVAELATTLARGKEIAAQHVPLRHVPFADATVAPVPPAGGAAQADGERERIIRALEAGGGNQTRATALLGISRRTLVTRLAEYDIPRPKK